MTRESTRVRCEIRPFPRSFIGKDVLYLPLPPFGATTFKPTSLIAYNKTTIYLQRPTRILLCTLYYFCVMYHGGDDKVNSATRDAVTQPASPLMQELQVCAKSMEHSSIMRQGCSLDLGIVTFTGTWLLESWWPVPAVRSLASNHTMALWLHLPLILDIHHCSSKAYRPFKQATCWYSLFHCCWRATYCSKVTFSDRSHGSAFVSA